MDIVNRISHDAIHDLHWKNRHCLYVCKFPIPLDYLGDCGMILLICCFFFIYWHWILADILLQWLCGWSIER